MTVWTNSDADDLVVRANFKRQLFAGIILDFASRLFDCTWSPLTMRLPFLSLCLNTGSHGSHMRGVPERPSLV